MRVLFITFFMLNGLFVVAQNVPEFPSYNYNLIPPSPEVASLGKFAVHNVGYATGKPQISLPVYTIKSGSITVPISIDYSAGGIKVEEMASSCGLGWSLSAGGMISRTSVGVADDYPEIGYLDNAVNNPKTLYENWLATPMGGIDTFRYLRDAINSGSLDVEPDMYFFNLPGKSGKFMINNYNKKAYTISFEKLDIAYERSVVAGGFFSRWIVTLDDGTRYVLGRKNSNDPTGIEESNTSTQTSVRTATSTSTTAWFLKEIISANNEDTVRFNYLSYNTGYCNQLSHSKRVSTTNDYSCLPQEERSTSRNDVSSYMIESINGRFGSVTFTYEGGRLDLYGGKILKEIIVRNASNGLINTFQLTQSYFKSDANPNPDNLPCAVNYTGSQSWRLKLDEFKQVSSMGVPLIHSFEYDYHELTRPLPSRLSYAQDDWGYYNGRSNHTLVPRYPSDAQWALDVTVLDGAIRKPSETHTKIGSLTKITYPTGGSSVYEYELNEAYTHEYIHEVGLPDEDIPYIDYARIESNTILAPGFPGSQLTSAPFTISNASYRNPVSYIQMGFIHPNYGNCDYEERGDRDCRVFVSLLDVNDNVVQVVPIGTQLKIFQDGVYKLRMVVLDKNEYTENVTAYIRGPQALPRLYNKKMGGLRIKSIVDYDGINTLPVLKKEYKYKMEDTLTSSGVANFYPSYHAHLGYSSPGNMGGGICHAQVFQRTAVSNMLLTSFAGSPVTYSRVESYTVGNPQKLKSAYSYSSEGDDWGAYMHFPHPPGINLEHRRGLLLKEEHFKDNNGSYEIVNKKENIYQPWCIDDDGNDLTCPNMKWHYGLKIYPSDFGVHPAYNYLTSSMNLYRVLTEWVKLSEVVEKTYSSPAVFIENRQVYNYEQPTHGKITKSTAHINNLEKAITEVKYSEDYDNYTPASDQASAILNIKNKKAIVPVEKLILKKDALGNEYVTAGTLLYYKSGSIRLHEIYSLDISTPVPVGNFVRSYINTAGVFVKDQKYRKVGIYYDYDTYGNLKNTSKADDVRYAYIYDYKGLYPISQVINGTTEQIAHTSFEADGTGNVYLDQPQNIVSGDGVTGNKCYAINGVLARFNLNTAQTYVVSLWTKNGVPNYNGFNGATQVIADANNWVAGKTVNGWTYREKEFTGVTIINVGGGGGLVDEVRIYPKGAQMTTYTYDPLVGMTSQCDVNNRITYYEYDGFGRLKLIRDENKNVLKTFDYQYQQALNQ